MLKTTKIILFITIFWLGFSYAEIAAPLGIELGKSTLKRALFQADNYLKTIENIDWVILQPSIMYASGCYAVH